MAEVNFRLRAELNRLKNNEVDWRSSCRSLVEQWGEARKRNLYTDVEFLVGEGSLAVSFSAHKIVLSFCSPVFEAMFYGQLAEKKSPIRVVDIEPESFEILLRFVYGEEITFESVVSAAKTYFAADKYLIDQMKTAVENYIPRSAMNDSQFWEIILQEKYFRIPATRSKCLDYISKHACTLLKCEKMLNISLDVMKAILQLDYLNASEYELLSTLGRWSHEFFTTHRCFATESTMDYLLPHIRFSNITTDEFSSFDESHRGTIGSDDSLAILKHLCNPSKFKLPHWCSVSTQKRNSVFSNTIQPARQDKNQRNTNNPCNPNFVKRNTIGCVILR